MRETVLTASIPLEVAIRICGVIQHDSLRNLHPISALWCKGCSTFSKGQIAVMCGGVVACPQVVAQYERRMRARDLQSDPSGGKA